MLKNRYGMINPILVKVKNYFLKKIDKITNNT
jgi:hypothetical protein